jgi:hypothetical protein
MYRDGGPGIMPHDVPLVDVMFHSDFLDLVRKRLQLRDTTTILGSPPKAGQIDSHASEASQQFVDDPTPKLAARRYTVYE